MVVENAQFYDYTEDKRKVRKLMNMKVNKIIII